ncbi:hypothetical protein JCM19233_5405 [Vibrio astriarenae]|nr:hypothetical protein JCM19233_5405 [Vibrio sp. C7]
MPEAIAEDIRSLGGEILLSTTVTSVENTIDGVVVLSETGQSFSSDLCCCEYASSNCFKNR